MAPLLTKQAQKAANAKASASIPNGDAEDENTENEERMNPLDPDVAMAEVEAAVTTSADEIVLFRTPDPPNRDEPQDEQHHVMANPPAVKKRKRRREGNRRKHNRNVGRGLRGPTDKIIYLLCKNDGGFHKQLRVYYKTVQNKGGEA